MANEDKNIYHLSLQHEFRSPICPSLTPNKLNFSSPDFKKIQYETYKSMQKRLNSFNLVIVNAQIISKSEVYVWTFLYVTLFLLEDK